MQVVPGPRSNGPTNVQPVEDGQDADRLPHRRHQPGERLPSEYAQGTACAYQNERAEEVLARSVPAHTRGPPNRLTRGRAPGVSRRRGPPDAAPPYRFSSAVRARRTTTWTALP